MKTTLHIISLFLGASILAVAMSGNVEHIEVEGSGAGINGRVILRRGHTYK